MDEFEARLSVVSTTSHARSQRTVEGSVSQWQRTELECLSPLEDCSWQNTEDTVLGAPLPEVPRDWRFPRSGQVFSELGGLVLTSSTLRCPWQFAESKTVGRSNECEDRVDEFEAKVACRVDDVASSVTKDS